MFNKALKIIRGIPNKVYKFIIIILLILTLIVWGFGPLIAKFEIVSLVKFYNTILNFFPNIEEQILKYNLAITIALLLVSLVYIIKIMYKEKALLIKHYSMSSSISEIDEQIYKEYKVTVCDINLFEQSNVDAISYQDKLLQEVLQKEYKQYFYYGIASTPYIFRLGYQFGDERSIRLLHKKRVTGSIFTEIKDKDDIHEQLKHVEVNTVDDSRELLVSLGTSFPITADDLKCFNTDTMYRLYFYTQSTSFDNILSYEQMQRYRDQIMDKIREWVKKYRINTIHIVSATSVAFTFYWAQNFSKNHDPEIIVYHYEEGKYPWGIRIKGNIENCIVENKDSAINTI